MFNQKIITSLQVILLCLVSLGCSRAILEDVPIASALTERIVDRIQVIPPQSTIQVGSIADLQAFAVYTDGSTEEITDKVQWTSMVPSVAAPILGQSEGEFMGITRGSGTINAAYKGKSATGLLTVTNSNLTSIQVTPFNESIAIGVSQSYVATGIYADYTKADITNQVTWTSSQPYVASVDDSASHKGHSKGLAAGSTTITATLGSISGATTLDVTTVGISTIEISPAVSTISVGSTIPYVATATYVDGTSKDISRFVTWSSSNPSIASISMATDSFGVATGLSEGQTFIRASFEGISTQATLNVNAAILTALEISPANASGAIQIGLNFTVKGTFSDGSTQDLTAVAKWDSSDALKLLLSDIKGLKGQALPLIPGVVTVSATVGGQMAMTTFTVNTAILQSVAILPAVVNLPLNAVQDLVAQGTFSDGTVKDITKDVVWWMGNSNIASIGNTVGTAGDLLATAVGSTTANITYLGHTAVATVTTTAAVLDQILVTAGAPNVALGKTVQMIATGVYSDGTTKDITNLVSWVSTQPSLLAPSNATGQKGLVYTVAQGAGNVIATLDGLTGSAPITVTNKVLVSIAISPTTGSSLVLGAKQFKATWLYSDGTSADITNGLGWSTSNNVLGSINSNGLFTGLNIGTISVTATQGSVTKTNTYTLKLF